MKPCEGVVFFPPYPWPGKSMETLDEGDFKGGQEAAEPSAGCGWDSARSGARPLPQSPACWWPRRTAARRWRSGSARGERKPGARRPCLLVSGKGPKTLSAYSWEPDAFLKKAFVRVQHLPTNYLGGGVRAYFWDWLRFDFGSLYQKYSYLAELHWHQGQNGVVTGWDRWSVIGFVSTGHYIDAKKMVNCTQFKIRGFSKVLIHRRMHCLTFFTAKPVPKTLQHATPNAQKNKNKPSFLPVQLSPKPDTQKIEKNILLWKYNLTGKLQNKARNKVCWDIL